jgi:site-specific DNA-methyltransferase (adenine-specific)
MEINKVYHGDCNIVMKTFPDNTLDSIVTDPPYALTISKQATKGFMGKKWDNKLPGIETWQECLRVAKPGAHMLAFGGTRTHHRLMTAIEDAGWELRDTLSWNYGSGFPKSRDMWKTDICPEIENQLREQGVIGTIEWK